MPVIEVEHLTKEYRLGALQGLKQTLLNAGNRLIGRSPPERPLFKALDDVNFSIEQGEVVGIIGHNGAGKSTLLKMLARISTPTLGSISVKGRIAPLIEVGAGFVPDFTGRENVYLNGAILGMSKKEIDRKFDEIVEFAEMRAFIDTPVKRYSSGMQVKLAFAVATSIESEILIVDEVLAVGDLAFQRKCFDRMEQLIKDEGRTVLLVSHNIRQVERLCSRVIVLSSGRVTLDDTAKAGCAYFYDFNNEKILSNQSHKNTLKSAEKSGDIDVDAIEIYSTSTDEATTEIVMHAPMKVRLHLTSHCDLDDLEFVLGVHTTDFVYLFSASSTLLQPAISAPQGRRTIEFAFSDISLTPGVYSLRLAVRSRSLGMLWYGENLLPFKVTPGTRSIATIPQLGIMDIPFSMRV